MLIDRSHRPWALGTLAVLVGSSVGYGVYAARSIDDWNRRMPLHINVEFDEPLL